MDENLSGGGWVGWGGEESGVEWGGGWAPHPFTTRINLFAHFVVFIRTCNEKWSGDGGGKKLRSAFNGGGKL